MAKNYNIYSDLNLSDDNFRKFIDNNVDIELEIDGDYLSPVRDENPMNVIELLRSFEKQNALEVNVYENYDGDMKLKGDNKQLYKKLNFMFHIYAYMNTYTKFKKGTKWNININVYFNDEEINSSSALKEIIKEFEKEDPESFNKMKYFKFKSYYKAQYRKSYNNINEIFNRKEKQAKLEAEQIFTNKHGFKPCYLVEEQTSLEKEFPSLEIGDTMKVDDIQIIKFDNFEKNLRCYIEKDKNYYLLDINAYNDFAEINISTDIYKTTQFNLSAIKTPCVLTCVERAVGLIAFDIELDVDKEGKSLAILHQPINIFPKYSEMNLGKSEINKLERRKFATIAKIKEDIQMDYQNKIKELEE